jgi:TFIIF-interacting CTD phosphatase-like protein
MTSKHLLILDLDETLVFADESPLAWEPDFVLPPYSGYFRPGLSEFVRRVGQHYDLAVWTSSSSEYAHRVCALVFADPSSLAFVWARDRCTPERNFDTDTWTHAKRLKKLRRKGYDLRRVLMVDDSPEKHSRNYGNLVAVKPFFGDRDDRELSHLAPYLVALSVVDNVRAIEKRTWARRVPGSPASITV